MGGGGNCGRGCAPLRAARPRGRQRLPCCWPPCGLYGGDSVTARAPLSCTEEVLFCFGAPLCLQSTVLFFFVLAVRGGVLRTVRFDVPAGHPSRGRCGPFPLPASRGRCGCTTSRPPAVPYPLPCPTGCGTCQLRPKLVGDTCQANRLCPLRTQGMKSSTAVFLSDAVTVGASRRGRRRQAWSHHDGRHAHHPHTV